MRIKVRVFVLQAFMLRRNLCHAQRPVAKDPAYATLQVAVHNAKTQRISILLALCRNGGDKSEVRPIAFEFCRQPPLLVTATSLRLATLCIIWRQNW